MKKIILSLAIVAAVGAVVVGGTIAYYSDTETSSGNTFTAGTLDLKIDSDCHFNGMDCLQYSDNGYYWDTNKNDVINDNEAIAGNECSCVWDEKSLTSEKFFNFANLKPGDSGEATISMHVIGDDAYARFKVDNVKNNDRGCNRQEKKSETWMYGAGSETCDWTGGGELGKNMDFAIWFDMGSQWGYQGKDVDLEEGDNILNTYVEYFTLGQDSGDGTAGNWVELKTGNDPITLPDGTIIPPNTYIPFGECKTYYIGVAWCVGDMTISGGGTPPHLMPPYTMTCDGSTAGNIIQSDSYISDSIFEVVQATHNDLANPFDGITP